MTTPAQPIGFRHHAAAAHVAAQLLRHHLELAREAAVSAAPPFWMSEGSWDAAALATVNALSDVDAAVTDAVAEAQRALNGLADIAREPAWSGASAQRPPLEAGGTAGGPRRPHRPQRLVEGGVGSPGPAAQQIGELPQL